MTESLKPQLLISNLSKSFGKKKILNDVNLSINKGASLGIIGKSGSGKSVLIKTIIGLIKLDSGNVVFEEKDITDIANRKDKSSILSRLGFLFQGGALFDSLPVWQNITFGIIKSQNLKKAEARTIAEEKLLSVGLDSSTLDLYPGELSGGMQKRVALARAIASKPEIIFLDEPTTGLDPIMANIINNLIVKCSQELGATTITITHDMNSLYKIAKRVAMIYEGSIIWDDSIENTKESSNPYVRQFINGNLKGPIEI